MTTQARYTPGPWTVWRGRLLAIIGPEPSWIGQIDRNTHNAEANARLIALAPEMAEALRKIARKGRTQYSTVSASFYNDTVNEAEAILAKLDGAA